MISPFARSTIWNLLGLALPLLFAIWAVPVLLEKIGAEKFGFLALAWGLVGYASLIDLGMSRALTQKLSLIRGTAEELDARSIVKSAVYLTLAISLVFFAAMALLSLFGLGGLITYEVTTHREIQISLLFMAITLPLQAVSLAFKGINEAYLNFRGISIVRIFLGAANFGAPCVVSYWTTDLHFLILTLLIARLLALIAYYHLSRHCLPPLSAPQSNSFNPVHTRALLRFGGWVAVSSVVSPLLTQADRFFIGAMMSATAVTNYVVPYELTVQSLILMGAVTTVAFPTIANLARTSESAARSKMRGLVIKMAALMAFAMVALAILMPHLLYAFVGTKLAPDSVNVGRVLCIGVFFYSIASLQLSFLHALGRTRITALYILLELPIYIALLYVLIGSFGIIGAAVAWTLRCGLDMVLMIAASRVSAK